MYGECHVTSVRICFSIATFRRSFVTARISRSV
jgi:hypothetical protein